MKKYYFAMLAYMFFATTSSYSSTWNPQCLDDCFSTHHECNYCDYQCRVPDEHPNEDIQTRQYVCPFTEHNYY